MIRYADVLVGLQMGDEGKGKVAHHLAKSDEYDVVLRYNGGSNAGHTVYHNGEKVVTHQVPVGVLYGKPSIIGPGCVVNHWKLLAEISELSAAGINTNGLVLVDKRAHLVLDSHTEEDGTDTAIGTTRQGIGPAYRDKYGRTGVRAEKLIDPGAFNVIDIYEYLHNSDNYIRILCEGAQGFHLDIDWGKYPYVTSSHCTAGAACLNGIPPHKISKVIGTMKAYETYVGNRKDYTDEADTTLSEIQRVGNEFGATTGRPRKVNYLNLDRVAMAIQINGVTDIIINKLDVLEEVGVFSYIYKDKLCTVPTVNEFMDEVGEIVNIYGAPKITWSSTPHGI